MMQKEWAEKELEIAKEDFGWDEYQMTCTKSAYNAFCLLLKDGHSGYSWGMTVSILKRLIDTLPLTPIVDTDDIWTKCTWDKNSYQCKRYTSLFKELQPDGLVRYYDTDRVAVSYEGSDGLWGNGLVSRLVDKIHPIEMPYIPRKNLYIVHAKEGKYIYTESGINRTCDLLALIYLENTAENKTERILRYFKYIPSEGYTEISKQEYNRINIDE